ncbi:hypothetical protein NA57DRAFT_73036 [Rhizodiscina lignyota]|uniref:Uncharacterized protein n=1 Tax=Rhizodiscina lignyota TaxID=1504668 RepID=A0A9P4INY6_9PEZI|nr:hypothetical protein NA57DRAFT_73036 [Rhizodiscina lignyota]
MEELGDASTTLAVSYPPRSSSLQARHHPQFTQPHAVPVKRHIQLFEDVMKLVDRPVNALQHMFVPEEEITLIQEYVKEELIPDKSALENPITRVKVYTSALKWARAVRCFRTIEQLENDINRSEIGESAKRGMLYRKLDVLRPILNMQLRYAVPDLLAIRDVTSVALWREDSAGRTPAEVNSYMHALRTAKLFAILEEIDELGEDEDAEEMERKHVVLEEKKAAVVLELRDLESYA